MRTGLGSAGAAVAKATLETAISASARESICFASGRSMR